MIYILSQGSIYLKNTLMKFWKEHEGDENRFSISNGDKELMRENMVEAIIHAPDMIRQRTETDIYLFIYIFS